MWRLWLLPLLLAVSSSSSSSSSSKGVVYAMPNEDHDDGNGDDAVSPLENTDNDEPKDDAVHGNRRFNVSDFDVGKILEEVGGDGVTNIVHEFDGEEKDDEAPDGGRDVDVADKNDLTTDATTQVELGTDDADADVDTDADTDVNTNADAESDAEADKEDDMESDLEDGAALEDDSDTDADMDMDKEIDFEVDLEVAQELLEKLRREGVPPPPPPPLSGIFLEATTNTDLVPTRPTKRVRRKVTSTNALIRRTDAFGLHFKGGIDLAVDRDKQRRRANQKRPRVQVIRGSNSFASSEDSNSRASVLTVQHGLVETVIEAYNHHLNLVLRPDDFWITILTQFSSYVNGKGRAKKLRNKFVTHRGKKKLTVTAPANDDIYTVDVGRMARLMLDEIAKNIKDESLREWFLPGFTTTTQNDEVCASAAAMCTLQEYFEYAFDILCGIPEVTLLGTLADWKLLRDKVDRLLEFQVEGDDDSLATWVGLLQRICDELVESRKNGSKNNIQFWDTVAHRSQGGSSEPYLSGWITAFSYFDSEGQVVSPPTGTRGRKDLPEWNLVEVTAGFLDDTSDKYIRHADEYSTWPIISSLDIPSNVVSCPVQITDHGVEYDARLFVGQMALDYQPATRNMKKRATPVTKRRRGRLFVVQGRNDWALVVAKPSTDA